MTHTVAITLSLTLLVSTAVACGPQDDPTAGAATDEPDDEGDDEPDHEASAFLDIDEEGLPDLPWSALDEELFNQTGGLEDEPDGDGWMQDAPDEAPDTDPDEALEEPGDGSVEEDPTDDADGDTAQTEEAASDTTAGAPGFAKRKFLLPFRCNKRVLVTQGNNTNFSHNGFSRWAYDFRVNAGTQVRAMKSGKVIHVRRSTRPGHPCYDGGGPECRAYANYVVLRHKDGSRTSYAHLNSVSVRVGDRVKRGAVIARSGTTGYSTGPHLHVARQELCASAYCQSIPLRFADVSGNHRPRSGQWVRSKNGCD